MEKFTKKYKDFMFESLEDKFKDKISDNESLKRGILLLLDNSVEDSDNLVNVQNFINSYIKDSEKVTLVGLIDDAEIFDFWNKYKSEIDEVLKNQGFFDKTPTENNIFSIYDMMIHGTKIAVQQTMKSLEKDLFSETSQNQDETQNEKEKY